ncbi:MAG TPA: hypothetical protein VIZ61_03165 [Solirubrobacterales bacterium]
MASRRSQLIDELVETRATDSRHSSSANTVEDAEDRPLRMAAFFDRERAIEEAGRGTG